jgi:hypothetical protein
MKVKNMTDNGNKFNELLLMYKYNYSLEKIEEIGNFWGQYIDFDKEIMAKNFLSSKYALAVGDVAKELIDIFPYIKIEFEREVVKSVKKEGQFNVDKGGFAFQYFCYSLFKDYKQIIPADETSCNSVSNDFVLKSVPGIEFEVKIKANESNIQKGFRLFEAAITDILSKRRYRGNFYINLTFNEIEIERIESKVSLKIKFLLLELLKKVNNVDYSLLAEDIEHDDSLFCVIKIHYQPINMGFNDYRIGGEVAGFFANGHNIGGEGGFYYSVDYIDLSLECYIEGWINRKFANCNGILFFSTKEPLYNDESLKKAFIIVNQKYPNFIGMVYVDLWNDDQRKLAVLKMFYKDEESIKLLLGQFNEDKVKLICEKC